MPELLFEVYCEEIPAQMQATASEQLLHQLTEELKAIGITSSGKSFSTPRRVGFAIGDLPINVEIPAEEIRGPKTSAPDQALTGFLGKHQISKEQLIAKEDYFYFCKPAAKTNMHTFLSDKLTHLISSYTWPKSMRWGSNRITWVRPIKSILAVFDNAILPVQYGPISSGNISYGHFFTNNHPFTANNFAQYTQTAKEHGVIVSPSDRKASILKQIETQAQALNIKMVNDEKLLDEVVGLVEAPYVHICEIDDEFMKLPREVLVITLRHHQRYIMFENQDGSLAKYYAIVANIQGNQENITVGNHRVLKARLYDAKFFYEQDLKTPLISRLEPLKSVVYHQQLGSVYDKVIRVKELAIKLASHLGIDPSRVSIASELAKCDLVSSMVKEFPELQGVMGSYYAAAQGIESDIAASIKDHYKPQGPNDGIPGNKIGAIVALADKIDSLNSLFGIGIRPTGSKDPFAQRRMALGIIRINKEFEFNLAFSDYFSGEVLKFITERLDS